MDSLLLLAASDPTTHRLSIFEPVSPPAESIRNLSILVLAITGFIFVIVELILFYCIFRFRRKGPISTSESEPPQVYGSKPIEIAWTAAPGSGCLHPGAGHDAYPLGSEQNPSPTEARRQRPVRDRYRPAVVVGIPLRTLQRRGTDLHHGQRVAHPGQRPKGRRERVWLKLRSADVCHSFWVPRWPAKWT